MDRLKPKASGQRKFKSSQYNKIFAHIKPSKFESGLIRRSERYNPLIDKDFKLNNQKGYFTGRIDKYMIDPSHISEKNYGNFKSKFNFSVASKSLKDEYFKETSENSIENSNCDFGNFTDPYTNSRVTSRNPLKLHKGFLEDSNKSESHNTKFSKLTFISNPILLKNKKFVNESCNLCENEAIDNLKETKSSEDGLRIEHILQLKRMGQHKFLKSLIYKN